MRSLCLGGGGSEELPRLGVSTIVMKIVLTMITNNGLGVNNELRVNNESSLKVFIINSTYIFYSLTCTRCIEIWYSKRNKDDQRKVEGR